MADEKKYIVEKLGNRRGHGKHEEVFVTWKGFAEGTWEPVSNVAHLLDRDTESSEEEDAQDDGAFQVLHAYLR